MPECAPIRVFKLFLFYRGFTVHLRIFCNPSMHIASPNFTFRIFHIITSFHRFCNLTPSFTVLHKPTSDIQFKGFTIPANFLVIGDMCSVLADNDIWGDPEVFRPERFLDEQGRLVRHEAFIPFMIGKAIHLGICHLFWI